MVHAFPKGISPKVNVIAQTEFEFSCSNVMVQHVSHDSTETPLFPICISHSVDKLGKKETDSSIFFPASGWSLTGFTSELSFS